jgi:hypothetical protein
MKISLSLLLAGVALALSSCATTTVQVIDSGSKLPVGGAAVRGVNGDLSTGSTYTDANGYTAQPVLPNGVREIVVTKSGYNTKRVKLY